jgi:hypothetical protein
LMGLLRDDDFTSEGKQFLPTGEKEALRRVLVAVFDRLTRTESPLFRRAMRGAREEFELVHDLLGLILLKWRADYKAEAAEAAKRTVAEVFRPDENLPRPLPIDDPWVSESMTSARRIFYQYTRDLGSIDDAGEAMRNGEVMKSGFKQVGHALARVFEPQRYELRRGVLGLGPAVGAAFDELRKTAISHASRDVRKVLQRQAYEFKAMWDHTELPPYYSASSSSGSIVHGLIRFAVVLGFAAAGMVIARALIGQFWQAPTVEYIWLTLAVTCCAAALMYLITYFDALPRGQLSEAWRGISSQEWQQEWHAIRKTLWPIPSDAYSRRNRLLLYAAATFTSWPVLFVTFLVLCFTGALIFELFGWAPTAGFNLTALLSSIGLLVAYFIASDL